MFRPGSTVKLHFLSPKLCQKPWSEIWPKIWSKIWQKNRACGPCIQKTHCSKEFKHNLMFLLLSLIFPRLSYFFGYVVFLYFLKANTIVSICPWFVFLFPCLFAFVLLCFPMCFLCLIIFNMFSYLFAAISPMFSLVLPTPCYLSYVFLFFAMSAPMLSPMCFLRFLICAMFSYLFAICSLMFSWGFLCFS